MSNQNLIDFAEALVPNVLRFMIFAVGYELIKTLSRGNLVVTVLIGVIILYLITFKDVFIWRLYEKERTR